MGRWVRGIAAPALAAGVVLGVGAGADAQTAPVSPNGVTQAADGLQVTGSAEVFYDSNQLRSTGGAFGNPTGHADDFRYSPEVSATYGRNAGLISATLNGLVGRDFFQYNRYLDRNQYVGGGVLTYRSPAGCQLSVDGNYSARQSGIRSGGAPLIDPSGVPIDNVGEVIDNVLTSTTYGANAACGSPTGRLTFGGGYVHSSLSNGSPLRRVGDSDSDTFSGNIGLGILQPGQLSLNGSYSTIAYPNRGTLGLPPGVSPQLASQGVKTYRIGVSFSRPIGRKLSGSIGVAFLHSDPGGGQAAYNSPAYNVGLSFTPSERLSFALNGSRDIVPSTTVGASFRRVDSIELTSHYRLGRAITFNANAGFIGNSYTLPFAIPGEPARRSDMTKSVGVGIVFAPRRLYDLSFNVGHLIRNADPSILNYTSTTAGLKLAIHL